MKRSRDNQSNLLPQVERRKFSKDFSNSLPRKAFIDNFRSRESKQSLSDLPFSLSPRKVFQREFNEHSRRKRAEKKNQYEDGGSRMRKFNMPSVQRMLSSKQSNGSTL